MEYMGTRGQLGGVSCLLPPCETHISNLGRQASQLVPLPLPSTTTSISEPGSAFYSAARVAWVLVQALGLMH